MNEDRYNQGENDLEHLSATQTGVYMGLCRCEEYGSQAIYFGIG